MPAPRRLSGDEFSPMSFKSYATQALPDGSLVLEDPQPLIFSGKQGLIARFVLAEGDRAQEAWRLCAGEVHALAAPMLQTGERMIVFEQTEGDTLELLVLEAIHGVSTKQTEMLFTFRPLVVLSRTPRLCARHAEGGKIYSERLSLDGGALAPAASWRWQKPHLALGGVVCGAEVAPIPRAAQIGAIK